MKKNYNAPSYEFLAGYGSIGTKKNRKGQTTQIQLCKERWYGYETFSIRCFTEDGTPEKGISLKLEDLKTLKDLLNSIDLEKEI